MGKELPYEGEIKPISGPHCTTPWLSPSEISLLIQLSRKLFVRLHTVAQLFLPLGVFGLFEKENFLSLVPPFHAPTSSLRIPQGVSMSNTALRKKGESEYIIAPDEAGIKTYLGKTLLEEPGAVILPE